MFHFVIVQTTLVGQLWPLSVKKQCLKEIGIGTEMGIDRQVIEFNCKKGIDTSPDIVHLTGFGVYSLTCIY